MKIYTIKEIAYILNVNRYTLMGTLKFLGLKKVANIYRLTNKHLDYLKNIKDVFKK